MKLHGKSISKPTPKLVVIPRGAGEDLIFHVERDPDISDFLKICPAPEPIRVTKPGGESYLDLKDPLYLEREKKHDFLHFCFTMISSLSATDGIEWEKVDLKNPATWEGFEKELLESGLTQKEVSYLLGEIVNANIITKEQVDEARERFFALQQRV